MDEEAASSVLQAAYWQGSVSSQTQSPGSPVEGKGGANLLQGLDIDESLGLEQVDEQIRDYLSTKGVRVIELFRQWDDDGTGKIEKKEFRRGMKELGLNVAKAQLDELFDMWDPDKSGAALPCTRNTLAALTPVPAHAVTTSTVLHACGRVQAC